MLHRDDADYPAMLRRSPDPPGVLHVDGDAGLLWHPSIAIVGSRAATANGFDTAAHLGAVDAGGTTVAVLGSGIDVAFPRANRALMARLPLHGAVVSELPPGTPAHASQFPSRNRIVAGLSLGTLVVEAAWKSGALITARLATGAGREVFALPGSIHNPMARGCHRLIRDGVQLVESPEEVIAALKPLLDAYAGDLRARLHAPNSAVAALQHDSRTMDADTQRLWDALGYDPTPMDALVTRTGLTSAELVSMLLVMELEGRVVSELGRYTRRVTCKAS